MKKRMLAVLLAMLILTVPAMAYTENQQNTADALNHMELFLGKGGTLGYDLDAKLNRNQGVILLVRMLGKEEEAMSGKYQHPFKDVPAGASAHVAYAYSNGIVNGYTATAFGGSDVMTDKMFLALSLRALGYTDKGDSKDFEYANSRQMAHQVGLVENPAYDTAFTRGEAVEVFWEILHTEFKGQDKTLGDQLVEQQVITKTDLNEAAKIQENGKKEESKPNSGSSGVSGGSSNVGGGSSSNAGGSSAGTGNSGSAEPVTPDAPKEEKTEMTWDAYQKLSQEKKQEFFESFSNPMDFFTWQTAAKEAYDKARPSIEIGTDGSVDLGEL